MTETIFRIWRPKGLEWLEVEHAQGPLPDEFPVYYVSDYEFTLVWNGNMKMTYQGSRYSIEGADQTPGRMLFQHPHSTVGAERIGEKKIGGCITLKISEAQFMHFAHGFANGESSLPYFKTPMPNTNVAEERLSALTFNAFQSVAQSDSQLEREESILRLIKGSIELFGKPSSLPSSLHSEHRAVTFIKDYLLEHSIHDVTLDDLAVLSEFNKYYLLQVFRQNVGVSPHVYQTSIRIQQAKNCWRKA